MCIESNTDRIDQRMLAKCLRTFDGWSLSFSSIRTKYVHIAKVRIQGTLIAADRKSFIAHSTIGRVEKKISLATGIDRELV